MPEMQGRVTLWGVEVFLAVAEEGSITASARRLGVTPPAVSQQIAAMEATLGVVLFDRTARPFRLTPAGQIFRRHAQVMQNAEAEARADLARADLTRLTTLRLGMIEDFDAEVTPRVLSNLSDSMPRTRFLLETGPSHRLLDQLEGRALDIAVAAEPGGEVPDASWREVHPLMDDPFVAVWPRSTDQVPLILYSSRHVMGRQIAAHLARQNLRHAVRFELDSYNAILALVAQGKGWTILTPLALHHAARFLPGLRVLPLEGEPLSRRIALSARADAMADLPAQVATALRGAIGAQVIRPAIAQWPWLAPQLRPY